MHKEHKNGGYDIKNAEPSDSSAIVRLLKQSWLDTYVPLGVAEDDILELFSNLDERSSQLSTYLSRITDGTDIGLVARTSGTVIGICFGHQGGECAELTQIYVAKEYQGKGVGRSLLSNFLQHTDKNILVSVYEKNQQAIDFYQANNFLMTSRSSKFVLNDRVVLSEVVLQRLGTRRET